MEVCLGILSSPYILAEPEMFPSMHLWQVDFVLVEAEIFPISSSEHVCLLSQNLTYCNKYFGKWEQKKNISASSSPVYD